MKANLIEKRYCILFKKMHDSTKENNYFPKTRDDYCKYFGINTITFATLLKMKILSKNQNGWYWNVGEPNIMMVRNVISKKKDYYPKAKNEISTPNSPIYNIKMEDVLMVIETLIERLEKIERTITKLQSNKKRKHINWPKFQFRSPIIISK